MATFHFRETDRGGAGATRESPWEVLPRAPPRGSRMELPQGIPQCGEPLEGPPKSPPRPLNLHPKPPGQDSTGSFKSPPEPALDPPSVPKKDDPQTDTGPTQTSHNTKTSPCRICVDVVPLPRGKRGPPC